MPTRKEGVMTVADLMGKLLKLPFGSALSLFPNGDDSEISLFAINAAGDPVGNPIWTDPFYIDGKEKRD